jgi:hypothetical protein
VGVVAEGRRLVGVGQRLGERKKEKKSEGKGAAAAAWRRDRFRVCSFLSFFLSKLAPLSVVDPPGMSCGPIIIGKILVDS